MVETPHDPVAAVAALDEPTRRRLYDYVVRQPAPVGKDEAATAVGVPRTTVAFHLDRLVAEGLLDAVHERRTGRTGPGAGRPAKLYRRSAHPIAVSLPENRYELIGTLLADAVHESDASGEPARAVLHRRARDLGHDLGRGHGDTLTALEELGFEPRTEDRAIVLGNCPFHALAQRHTELVCGANLCLLEGLLDGLADTGRTARLAPAPGHCCVRLEPAAD
ncbi:helix-turn-helix transcriptional regulator [Saccharothrix variisporea]|uniref:Putative ArsR family transcriptional regulator n=1 Tax=Saccharothrix variisporea TaxID=543527 RepID=A0A495WZX9_9PSEU|nr:helix-turn-helix domain-containing protein [Saccharothrix variisporea]RKT67242.1 putative ArsR family transcriptional regulator [Saccharothrix variisporea]